MTNNNNNNQHHHIINNNNLNNNNNNNLNNNQQKTEKPIQRTIHHTLPNVPVNSKLPIPSFYENANGQWILSDNWDLYGLSGSTQRHRARSLEEPSSSSTLLLHHASAASSLPMLQYELSSNSSNSNSNSQKLYLPAGWNHTSRRGPLYATSVIVVASLLIAIAVLSTVVCLVVRRRARRRRRTRLKNSLSESLHSPGQPSSKTSSLRDIEQGHPTTRSDRLKHRLNRKLKQLTIIKINYLTKGRKEAQITRIPIATHPDGARPPSVILVDQVRRSASLSSQCRFRSAANRQNLRRRSHLGSQIQPDHPTPEFLSNQRPDGLASTSQSHIEIPIPLCDQPNIHATHEVLQLQTTDLHDRDDPLGAPPEPHPSPATNPSSTTLSSSFVTHSNQSTSSRPYISTIRPHHPSSKYRRPPSPTGTPSASSRSRQDLGRASVDPNYRSCHDIIRERGSTISGPQSTHLPIASSSSSSFHSGSLALSHPTRSDDVGVQQPQYPSARPDPSGGPSVASGGHNVGNEEDTRVDVTTFGSVGTETQRQSDPSPPAYSTRTIPAEGSRAAEKRRMAVYPPEGEEENLSTESPVEQTQEDGNDRQGYYGVPLVAHVATDDKSVLKTLLKMGSAPAIRGTSSAVEDQRIIENESERIHDANDRLHRTEGSGWRRRSRAEGYEEEQAGGINPTPSAPPLLYEGEGEGEVGDAEFALDRRRPSRTNTTQSDAIDSKETKIDGQQHCGLYRELDDDQIGQSFQDLNILPLPSDQFIIRFDPDNFEEANTKNTNIHMDDPSSLDAMHLQESHQGEDLYNYRTSFTTEDLRNPSLDANSFPSAPPIPHPSSLFHRHDDDIHDPEKILNYSHSNMTPMTVTDINTANEDINITPSAPPLHVENLSDDMTSIPFQPFVPPYAE